MIHWTIFRQLCEDGKLKGKLVADAVHAAVAIESGCEWATADTDFARFAPLLRWAHL
ncbi:MAG: PIN domain-containing protein [Bryobacteraceae bacterium]